jgi:hypothetical protein
VDTGWLLVGVAGVSGGLALVLIGAGIATSPLLLPVGAVLAFGAYLAWMAGSSRVVATVYEEVGDPDGSAGEEGRTGRRRDRMDPDGNWGTAADGGREQGTGRGGAGSRRPSGDGRRAGGVGPDGREVWDARERDRVGGWDEWEWTDRRWREFEREYAGGAPGDDAGDGSGATGGGTRQRTRGRADGARGHGRRRPDPRAARAREVLGVDPDADAEAIRRAYRERVKETHPDRDGDPEAFKRVRWAYEYLSERE